MSTNLQFLKPLPIRLTITAYLDSHEIIAKDAFGKDWLIDPFVSCAVETSDENFEEAGRAMVGKEFIMEDYFLCDGRPYNKPPIWVPNKFTEVSHNEASTEKE